MSRLDYIYRTELPHRAVSVYIYLLDRANKDGECWPAIPTMSKELKLSQSTIRRALHDLRKEGLIETEQRYRKKGGKSSLLYKLKHQKGQKNITLPPRDNYILLVVGGTCHDVKRNRTTHLKRYYNRKIKQKS